MKAGQERHCKGKKYGIEPQRRRGLRKFTEAHVAFLNAAYSAGEYLLQTVSREDLPEVKSMLKEPNIKFHRELRNTVDHTGRPDYSVTFEVHQVLALSTPETFPHPDLRVAMSKGVVMIEGGPAHVGTGHMTYERKNLIVEDARRLDLAMTALGVRENPSVVYMAERCYDRLLSFATSAGSAND
jgi:hypothetical protein